MDISQITRRDIVGAMMAEKVSWSGRLEAQESLARLFDLKSLPSNDRRFDDAACLDTVAPSANVRIPR